MKQIRVIIFDFDGVIVESAGVKEGLFHDLFSNHPDHIDEIDRYQRVHAGCSRFEKIDHILKHILKKDAGKEEKDRMYECFARAATEKVARCSYVEGALECLKYYSEILPLYLVSATPQEEMRRIAADRNISQYFQGIYGAPARKRNHFATILNESGCLANEVLYIGDSLQDYEEAKFAGLCFVGRVADGCPNVFEGCEVNGLVRDLSELEKLRMLNCEKGVIGDYGED